MLAFRFMRALCFDTDSGGAPGGSTEPPPASSPVGSGQDGGPAGGSTPNPFDALVGLIQDSPPPAQPAQPGQPGQNQDQIARAGSTPQGQQPDPNQIGTQPLQRVDLTQRPTPPPQPGQQPPAQPDPRDQQLEQMRQELSQLRGIVQAQAQPRPAQPQAQSDQSQPRRRYEFNAPAQVVEALRSEDPNVSVQTLFSLFSDVAENVHNRIMQDVQQLAPHLIRTAVQQADATAQNQNVERDFYGTHRDLDQDHLRPIVRIAAAQLAQEQGQAFRWQPETRDEIARRTREILFRTVGAAQNYRPTPDQVAGHRNPAQLSPQGTRPNTGVQPNGAVNDHNSPQAIISALGL